MYTPHKLRRPSNPEKNWQLKDLMTATMISVNQPLQLSRSPTAISSSSSEVSSSGRRDDHRVATTMTPTEEGSFNKNKKLNFSKDLHGKEHTLVKKPSSETLSVKISAALRISDDAERKTTYAGNNLDYEAKNRKNSAVMPAPPRRSESALAEKRKNDAILIHKFNSGWSSFAWNFLDITTKQEKKKPKVDGIFADFPETSLFGNAQIRQETTSIMIKSIVEKHLTPAQRSQFQDIVQQWEVYRAKKNKPVIPTEWILRFCYAHQNTTTGDFMVKKTFKSMVKFNPRYISLDAIQMRSQLRTKTLFPVPGLKSKDGHDMFYMRPSRYKPSPGSVETIIDNLAYAVSTLTDVNFLDCASNGIGFLANMDDFTMKENFDVQYCYKFMMGLQNVIFPVKVQLFLIVNPPAWFGACWKVMKPMLAPSFRKKVKMIGEGKLHSYLADDYYQFLPADMARMGVVDENQTIHEWIEVMSWMERTKARLEKARAPTSFLPAVTDGNNSKSSHNQFRDWNASSSDGFSIDDDDIALSYASRTGKEKTTTQYSGDDDGDDVSVDEELNLRV